jgi:hypothetical protein
MSLDLDAIRARADSASNGPWAAPQYDEDERAWFVLNGDVGQDEHAVACVAEAWSQRSAQANAEFIAHARADVPALLAEIELLHQVLRRAVSITQDTDGDPLDIDEEIPVGEVLRMLFEFPQHEAVVKAALKGGAS